MKRWLRHFRRHPEDILAIVMAIVAVALFALVLQGYEPRQSYWETHR